MHSAGGVRKLRWARLGRERSFESIMRGFNEIEAHQKGAIILRTTLLAIEPTPPLMKNPPQPNKNLLKLMRACRT